MSVPASIKPVHKAIQKYHETLHSFRQQEVEHEGATRFAFQSYPSLTWPSDGTALSDLDLIDALISQMRNQRQNHAIE